MVRITKTMQGKHSESLSPFVKEFCSAACSIPLPLLPQYLTTFPTRWPFPRGDLYHWIPLLNRFDDILDKFCVAYELDDPQTVDFGCTLLVAGIDEAATIQATGHDLADLGFSNEGDRELVESILKFSKLLLRNCGNRSIYASSSHLNRLLNSTSLSLLEITLDLGSELAQRYQSALKRMNLPVRSVTNSLLTNHYNISLDRVQQLALPFSKSVSSPAENVQSTTPATPSTKGKEKPFLTLSTLQKGATTTVFANDLASLVKGGSGIGGSPKSVRYGAGSKPISEASWDEWGDVKVTFYPKANAEPGTHGINSRPTPHTQSPATPSTPTPSRRSNLGPHGQQRADRLLTSDESPSTLSRASSFPATAATDDTPRNNFKVIKISASKIKSHGLHVLLAENMSDLPDEQRYELLTKLRVANALTTSLETRRQILAVRLLAITNLAYVHPEVTFLDTVLKQDSEEPRRSQLIYQLAELVHPPADGDIAVPRSIQTLALATLDAFTGIPTKNPDVCAALNTNVNHGVLLYVVRKAVAELSSEDTGLQRDDDDEWRFALFSLLSNLTGNPRTATDLVTAGLIAILAEVITLRTSTAERYQPTILTFLDALMYSTRDAFTSLVAADGLDAVSDLIVHTVSSASETSSSGMPANLRPASVDYDFPFFRQQTLKWLFKFIHHMMSSAGGYGGNFDRLLRNLIDSSALLGSLRQIIGNARLYGSVIWTNAVSILNDFINNEPTSFAVIAEAGLSRGLLEAVTGRKILMPAEPKIPEPMNGEPAPREGLIEAEANAESIPSDDTYPPVSLENNGRDCERYQVPLVTQEMLLTPRGASLARGILPTSETINIVPQAFSAICLNNAGMKMFQASNALEIFFEIFESPEHVKCMESNRDLPSSLGSSFDELVRHHPPLKDAIMSSIVNMVARVDHLCNSKSGNNKIGAKLWTTDAIGNPVIANEQIMLPLKGKSVNTGGDVEMQDADSIAEPNVQPPPSDITSTASMTPYITAVAGFLSAMFNNSSARSEFCSKGGLSHILSLTHSNCLSYDFGEGTTGRAFHQVIALLAETKPHLVMPSLLKSAQKAAEVLLPFASHKGTASFFAPFVDSEARKTVNVELIAKGTKFVKAFVFLNSLLPTINMCFQASAYNHRSTSNIFTQVNVADYYTSLVKSLGPLLGSSLREDLRLQKIVPEQWKNAQRVKETDFGDASIDANREAEPPAATNEGSTRIAHPSITLNSGESSSFPSAEHTPSSSPAKNKDVPKAEQNTPPFKNYQTLKFLLGKLPRVIKPFFQTVGKALVTKRTPDSFQKQGHLAIADALAESILGQLAPSADESSLENYTYLMGIMDTLSNMLIDTSHHNERPVQTITIVLQAFKDHGGIETLNRILKTFTNEICSSPANLSDTTEEVVKLTVASEGVKAILKLYCQIVNGKNLTEAVQTLSLQSRSERDRRTHLFSPGQLLVELRMAILPYVRSLWGSTLIEKGSSQISEKLIEVIRTISTADFEANVQKRADKPVVHDKGLRRTFKITADLLNLLTAEGQNDVDLAQEALYRCSNNIGFATEYCRMFSSDPSQRNPIPNGDLTPSTPEIVPSRPQTSTSTNTTIPADQPMTENLEDVVQNSNQNAAPAVATASDDAPNFDHILSQYSAGASASELLASAASSLPRPPPKEVVPVRRVTVDDLNEERALIREDLIDKCLEVINAHNTLTFEVADLITTVVNKSDDPPSQRNVLSETLVIALMSFASEDDLKGTGEKVAAYANLLALMLRDKLFYAASIESLKENLDSLIAFIRLSPEHSADDKSPWVSQILLIVEMLLSEDARPQKTKWTLPKDENDTPEPPVLEMAEPSFPPDKRSELLDKILEILPRIGKDDGLALAVLRILVILTRNRSTAQVMGEKKNIQRLFVMAKQLAGASSARIQSPVMIILRHIIEDDETVKQIMRSEIKSYLETNRQARSIDEKVYLRGLAHTALRNPELFVEVTNEMVKFSRWTYQAHQGRSAHTLVLKDTATETASKTTDDSVQPTVQATEDLTIEDVKTSTEVVDAEMSDVFKPVVVDQRLPVVENPDGVIHFLLCELINYRDVEDKEPAPVSTTAENTGAASNGDISMADLPTAESVPAKDVKSPKAVFKQDFKAEDHPIYIYRCFILQCLTELLSSYNRTKIEFINFKRSAPPQSMTPSKPRSSVVNYLLFDLIPIGTLDHAENTVLRKKLVTSNWADSVLTALLCKTGEQPIDKTREPYDSENEPNLLFVRRFVLENVLKAYTQASMSVEPLDVKYARMLSLADLMTHFMTGKENVGLTDTSIASTSQKQLRRIMFEKGYVAALTASIADIDLNFPGAKRAVKYILRPLKTLTTTAINLSDLSLITATPGQGEEDEIESATSLSEPEDDREETPDLFRNSTLGMLEYGREDDSSSDSEDEDEEMYEGEYEDEMDYDEAGPDGDEDGISDDDEEIEGMGDIEGLDGDHGVDVEVIMEEDDDDDDDELDSSGNDDDDHDSEDDDGRVEIIDEAGNIQQIAADEDMAEWESDDEDDEGEEVDYEGQAADQEEEHMHAIEMGGPIGQLVRALGDVDAADMIERMEAEGIDRDDEDDDDEEERIPGEYVEDDDEGDEEGENDEDDMIFDPYSVDGPGVSQFGWQEEVEPPVAVHRRSRGGFSPFPLGFAGGSRDPLGVPDYRASYRSHRPGAPVARAGDDGINPLLQRNNAGLPSRDGSSLRPTMNGWFQTMGAAGGELLDVVGRPVAGHLSRNGHALQFHITAAPGQPFPPDLQAMFGMGMRPSRFEARSTVVEPGSAAFFTPQSTTARWLEESRIVFGASSLERANDLATAILSLLVPPAIAIDKAAKAEAAEKARKAEEEAKKKIEEDRIAKEKKDEEDRIAREKKEAEEREEADRVAAEALAARQMDASEPEGLLDHPDLDRMDGIESEAPEQSEPSAVSAEMHARPRVTTMIRGNPFDITDLGIDAEFLAELPEEIREEVIMSAVAERRSAAAATGAQPSEIDQEFLDALPDDIRDEIMQQERQDRRRREREERNRTAAQADGGAAAVAGGDMDAATILATLPPALRNQVLMEQDDETLAQLPRDIVDQARAAMREQIGHRMPPRLPVGYARRTDAPFGAPRQATERPQRRAIVQMLDKSGIATLMRLMFIFQHGSLRTTLNSVLQNISLNRQNRNEVIFILLHILQDGSADMSAVERSFAHLSLKAKQPKDTQPKTPQPQSLKRTLTGLSPATQTTFEASPLMVVQQCLAALVSLNQVNPHIPAYFLTEHTTMESLKLSRKGKSKENKAAKYALNSLLSLLGRDLIMESSTVMESLSTLLNMITSPLQGLQRKQDDAKKKAEAEAATPAETSASTTSPETTTRAGEQPAEDQETTVTETTATVVETTPRQPSAEGGESSASPGAQDLKLGVAKEPAKEKKIVVFNPPIIPEQNLKLVINIFVARECSSKTFRETLSTIKNLSTIPNAKAVFGRELISKAQGLGEIILVDLEDLLPQIEKATTGTEIQGVALAKFSPGGSDQNKLLRVLTALDHLFDPKREKKDKPIEGEAEGESSQLIEKQDLLSSLYENSTFGRMWERLSACLGAIRQREHMLNVATILLPLIEALMVVCKNTTLKDNSISRTQQGKEMLLKSPPPESQMESLFYTFTEEHRKILNDLVRNTPKLMSGTFSLLVKNPKVLEFDNKRNYFSRSIHAKAPNSRSSFAPLQLSVRRDQVFHDSFKSLYFQTGDQMKYGKLSIRFHGEEGVDAGGVTREWFQVLSRQMFDPGYALFVPVSSDRTTFHPNHSSGINEEHLMFFKFIGRIIGKALYEGRVLDCHFSRAVYKRILGKAVSVKDMESLDLDYYKSLVWMLENDITDIITETFSTEQDKFGVTETIDFIPNGRNIAVTEENKHEYVRLMTEWRLTGSVKEQLDEFLKGFHDIIPAEVVAIFNEQELELLISGLPEIDLDDWKSNTEYHNYTASSPQIQWFWRAVRSYNKEERAKLLQFVTGTSKVPLNGFKELEGMNGFSRFNIHRDYGNKDRLPSSHTCFNQLDLPEYENYESLRKQVLTAITAGSEYFGFA